MWSATKVRAKITDNDPVFKARYIGCTEVFVASGQGCTNAPVQKLWDNAGSEKELKKVLLIINTGGITVKDSGKKNDNGKIYPIENISFCNADLAINERIFCWICKDDDSPSLLCHAVVCSSKENAKSLALVLSRAFQIAYKEWKTSKTREERVSRKGKTQAQIHNQDSIDVPLDSDSAHSSDTGSLLSDPVIPEVRQLGRRDSGCQTEINELANGFENSFKIKDSNLETVSEVSKTDLQNSVSKSVGTKSSLDTAEQEVLY